MDVEEAATPADVTANQVAVRGLWRRFGDTVALRDVTLGFDGGTVTGLVGKNGAGKSTLINVLSGAVAPSSGSVLIDGEVVTLSTPRIAVDHGVIAVHQGLDIFPGQSVAENVCLPSGEIPTAMRLIRRSAMRSRARSALDRVGVDVDVDRLAGDLSVSQQRMVTIARGLVDRPGKMIILDEPTESLTGQETAALFELIAAWRDQGLCVIYVSHRLDEVLRVSDRIVVMNGGSVVFDRPRVGVERSELVHAIAGEGVAPSARSSARRERVGAGGPSRLPAQGEPDRVPVAELKGVSTHKLADVTLDVRAGEILGIAGLVGSGRSTLARVLGGMEGDHRGEIRVDGHVVHLSNPARAHAAGIWYVPEDRKALSLFPAFEIWEDITAPVLERFRRAGFWLSRRRGIEHGRSEAGNLQVEPRDPRQKTRHLSGGNQQKVVLSRALQREMRLLVLDEPTQGVDVGTRKEIVLLLEELAGEGVGIVVISSDFEELAAMSDRVVVLRNGAVVGEFGAGEATEASLLEASSLDVEGSGGRFREPALGEMSS